MNLSVFLFLYSSILYFYDKCYKMNFVIIVLLYYCVVLCCVVLCCVVLCCVVLCCVVLCCVVLCCVVLCCVVLCCVVLCCVVLCCVVLCCQVKNYIPSSEMKIARNTVEHCMVLKYLFIYNICAIASMKWTHVVVAVLLYHCIFTCYIHIYLIICYSLFIVCILTCLNLFFVNNIFTYLVYHFKICM